RKRVGTLHLNRVLGGQHEERFWERIGRALHCYAAFLHRLKQRRLSLGRGAINLVGENDVGEQGSSNELKLPVSCCPVFFDYIGSGDIRRHQVRRELNSLEGQIENICNRPDQQRLGQSRHTGYQGVAPDKQGDQCLIDYLVLSDYDFAHLAQNQISRA